MIIPVDYAQVNVKFSGVSAPRGAQVVFGVKPDVSLDPADTAAVVAGWWASDLLQLQSQNITLDSVHCKFGPSDTGPEADVAVGTVGLVSASSLEPQVSCLVTKNTARGGRKGKGRMFVPGLLDSAFGSGGVLDPSLVTPYQSDFDDFLTHLSGAGTPMYLLHNENADTPDLVTSLTLSTLAATQRRRLRKVGGRRRLPPA